MPETSRTAIFSLNGWIERRLVTFILASATPMTVTATSPASCSIRFEMTKTPTTAVRSTGTFRYSGTAPRGKAQAIASAAT